jgi:hypothetical protein
VPYPVLRRIEEDLPRRGGLPRVFFTPGPLEERGILERIFPTYPKVYTYEIINVVEKDPQNGRLHLLIADEATKAICVETLVTYLPPYDGFLPPGSPNPQSFYNLAQKVDGVWSVTFLDNRAGTCR